MHVRKMFQYFPGCFNKILRTLLPGNPPEKSNYLISNLRQKRYVIVFGTKYTVMHNLNLCSFDSISCDNNILRPLTDCYYAISLLHTFLFDFKNPWIDIFFPGSVIFRCV